MNDPNPGKPVEELETIPANTEVTLQDLYDELYKQGELIIFIDKIDEGRVRKGLSAIKARLAAKLKDAGYKPDQSTLEFIEHEQEDPTKCKLQIVLQKRPTVLVHKVIVPQD